MNPRIQSLILLSAFSTVALVLEAGVAMAAPPPDPGRSVTVSYRDLNLSRSADVQKLYKRLRRAAMTVCTPTLMESPWPSPGTQRCYHTALNAAVRKVSSPELLALYRSTDHFVSADDRG